MIAAPKARVQRRTVGDNVCLSRAGNNAQDALASLKPKKLHPEVLESEEAVGRAMVDELELAAREKAGDLTIILLGGRGAQAMHRQLGHLAKTGQADNLLNRLNVFTQDALAPMRSEEHTSELQSHSDLV